ncbi:MAG: ATP-dependent DNA helicase, partial [Burkholderiales bacterium]
ERIHAALAGLNAPLQEQAGRSEGLAACARRSADALGVLARLREDEGRDQVRWVEVFGQSARLNITPLSSAELFARQMSDHPRAWIFTSATLAVGEDFGHFTRELGVPDAATRRWASPFDFPRQALLYVPKALPEPGEAGFTEAVIEAALPVLRASEGRAFLLFTTLRALRRAHQILDGKIDYPLLVQGTGSRSQLLSRFRALGNAVLLGSQSFWEGVDVRGDALSLVVIDKLPFAPPDDPVLAARIEGVRSSGGNPFNELQLPQAVLQLKQGAGRLIRDEADRGVLMLCDPRLVTKPYGRRILQSLPPMALTRELSAVERFFAARPAGECE